MYLHSMPVCCMNLGSVVHQHSSTPVSLAKDHSGYGPSVSTTPYGDDITFSCDSGMYASENVVVIQNELNTSFPSPTRVSK